MSTHLETVQRNYEAFAAGDVEAVLATFADDITWVEAEGGPYGGTYHGPDEVVENVFGPLGAEWEEFRVVPNRYVASGETVVAAGTYHGTHAETGESFEAEFAHIWDFRDEEVARFQQYIDTALHNEPLPDGG